MLTQKLIMNAQKEYYKTLAYLDQHQSILDAFGFWLLSLGGMPDRFGEFTESIVLHPITKSHPALGLHLCAVCMPDEEVAHQIEELENRLGVRLHFAQTHAETVEATYRHPNLGDIRIMVSNSDLSALHRGKMVMEEAA